MAAKHRDATVIVERGGKGLGEGSADECVSYGGGRGGEGGGGGGAYSGDGGEYVRSETVARLAVTGIVPDFKGGLEFAANETCARLETWVKCNFVRVG